MEQTGQTIDEVIAEVVRVIAECAAERKATQIRAVDVRGLVAYADYFVICSGRSERQVRAISEHIISEMRDLGRRPLGSEGLKNGLWVLLDFGDVVVHVFHEEERQEYDIERLWSNAPEMPLALEPPKPAASPAPL